MPHNIALKSAAERKQVEIELKASMLIRKQRLGKMSRGQIQSVVADIEDLSERQQFKNALNYFMRIETEIGKAA